MKKLAIFAGVVASALLMVSCANRDMSQGTCLNPGESAGAYKGQDYKGEAPAAPKVKHHKKKVKSVATS